MSWSDKIFAYCERAGDPAFWAEPVNAISNAAFVIAAVAAAQLLRRTAHGSTRRAEAALVGLTLIIGLGSFLFHTTATRWAAIADTAPIGLFMLGYFAYAVRRLLAASWPAVALATAAFVAGLYGAESLPCDPALLPVTAALGRPCFNGSLGYVPALVALVAIGLLLAKAGHQAASGLLMAAAVFAVSLAFRTLDMELCAVSEFLGRPRGTHAVWHLLNATVLYLLLRAAIRDGQPAPSRPPA